MRVLLPYLPWDDLSPNGQSDHVTLIDQVRSGYFLIIMVVQVELLGVDGINGDTMDGVGAEWWEEGTKRGLQLALEPEVLYTNFTYLQVFLFFSSANLLLVGRDVLGVLVPRLQHVRTYPSSCLCLQGNNWWTPLGPHM